MALEIEVRPHNDEFMAGNHKRYSCSNQNEFWQNMNGIAREMDAFIVHKFEDWMFGSDVTEILSVDDKRITRRVSASFVYVDNFIGGITVFVRALPSK